MPKVPKRFILRKLDNILDSCKEKKLTFISGKGCSGKSSSVTACINRNKFNYIWINIYEDFNNIIIFWRYIIEAFKGKLKGNESLEDLLQYYNQLDKDAFINYFLQEMKDEELVVVLNNLHIIENEEIISELEKIIKNSKANIHYILISRSKEPFYITDLIIKNEAIKIDEDDLNFTKDECRKLFKSELKEEVSSEYIDEVYKRSEGWIGGILISLLSFKKGNKEGNSYESDFIEKEYFSDLSDLEKKFLLITANMETIDLDICDDILQINNSIEIMEKLISKNLFIVKSEKNNKYRYQSIFKEFLIGKFNKLEKDTKEKIYTKLGRYYTEKEFYWIGIKYYLKCEEYKEIVDILQNINCNSLLSKEYYEILDKIPIKFIVENLDLSITYLYYCYFENHYTRLKELNNNIKGVFMANPNFIDKEGINVISLIDINLEEIKKLEISDTSRLLINNLIASTLLLKGEYEKAHSLLNECVNFNFNFNDSYLYVSAKMQLAQLFEKIGDIEKAEICQLWLIDYFKNKKVKLFELQAYTGIIGCFLKQCKLQEAKNALDICMSFENLSRNDKKSVLYNKGEYHFVSLDSENGIECFEELIKYIDNEFEEFLYLGFKLRCELGCGKESYFKLNEYKILYENANDIHKNNIDNKITYAVVICKLSEYEKDENYKIGIDILKETLALSRKKRYKSYIVEIILYIIDILKDKDLDERYLNNMMLEAIYYGCEINYKEPFILQNSVKDNLQNLLEINKKKLDKKQIIFLEDIIRLTSFKEDKYNLSEREIEVLKVLCTGVPNKEIAKELFISISTVKTHIINIYSKLGVSNRVEAAKKGREILKDID